MNLYVILFFILIILYHISYQKEYFDTMDVDEKVIKHIQSYPNESLDIFLNKSFKPECCPSLYTKSSGCMCKDETNHDLLIMRGGNRMLKDTYIEHEKNSFLFPPKCPQCPELYERDKQYFELSSD